MDLLKAPSIQSLLDSDLESVESLQYVEFEELDEVEYALPTSEAPTLAEVLSAEEVDLVKPEKEYEEPMSTSSALQVDFLQAISQQLTQAQERSSAGVATALSVASNGRLTVGTAHGHLLSFHEQILRWVCDMHGDNGAVTCLSYNEDSTRLLAGFARGNVIQYESVRGVVLRRVTLGGDTWGTLRVTWAGTSALALDTGGSVWLIKFSRPLGVRSAKVSCIFSGSRGEVVAMSARDARVLALATLSRVIIVAGGRAAGIRLDGPADVLPVLEWCALDNKVLVSARASTMQWLMVTVNGSSINIRPFQRMELKTTPLWLGWLGGSLAIFDSNENLRLWGDEYDKPLDLSQIEPVYSSAFFKGHWTDGRVSRAMCKAGESALGGICVSEGALSLLGRRGVLRVKPRDFVARAQAFIAGGRYPQALRLLCSTQGSEAKKLALDFVATICDRPHVLSNKNIAVQVVKLCFQYDFREELWNNLWENCSGEKEFVEALGEAVVRGELSNMPPSPDYSQALIERLGECEPELVERVVASLPLTALDPHRASVYTRERGLWRGVGAIAAALDGSAGAMRTLMCHVVPGCGGGAACTCAGGALLLTAADALAGRAAAGRPLPPHARPSARHDALHALLNEQDGQSPLRVLVSHDAASAVRLLEQCARDPPFAGPLGKQNRLRVARALLAYMPDVADMERRMEILEFICGQLHAGALPLDSELMAAVREWAGGTGGERAERAWLGVLDRVRHRDLAALPALRTALPRPRVMWHLDAMLDRHEDAVREFFEIDDPSPRDVDELFEYLESKIDVSDPAAVLLDRLPDLVRLRPAAAAALVDDRAAAALPAAMAALPADLQVEFGRRLLEAGRLRGEAAAAFLRALCSTRPAEVADFLRENVGAIRPEDALATVRELGARDAEPVCLEACGDPAGALRVALELAAQAGAEARARYAAEASELCARAAPALPRAAAAEMWTSLLRALDAVPAALLLEAVTYLPPEELAARTCGSARAALCVLAGARAGRDAWAGAARLGGRELHERLRRALAAGRRGAAVRGVCSACGRALSAGATRTLHCARAVHAGCDAAAVCACGVRVPATTVPLPQLPRRPPSPQLSDYNLLLVAPPRPDLEGVV
ncbi:vacuolar protein sorting-associated protein 8 homolog [Aricia agestis]|uniref:vacuolar protein sorting-associated protein 8 homolog n=1 Tax=Aricia agestis TaxID=91739 RepID=UPI001C204353|nr:vacuolar protein sorting-associated protein 8 homolog [Aricia agestis]